MTFTLRLDPIEPCRVDATVRVRRVMDTARKMGMRPVLVEEPDNDQGHGVQAASSSSRSGVSTQPSAFRSAR